MYARMLLVSVMQLLSVMLVFSFMFSITISLFVLMVI